MIVFNKVKYFDFVIIGSGPGGLTTALLLAKNFYRVALVEKYYLGGTCLNVGCIPSKYLLNLTQIYKLIRSLRKKDVFIFSKLKLNIEKINLLKNNFINKIRVGIRNTLLANSIYIIKNKFNAEVCCIKNTSYLLTIKDHLNNNMFLKTKNLVYSSGSKSSNKTLVNLNRKFFISNSSKFFNLKYTLKHICILGGGVIGLELAIYLQGIGSQVTLLEYSTRIIPNWDAELSTAILQEFVNLKVRVLSCCEVQSAKERDTYILINFIDKNNRSFVIKTNYLIIVTGRAPYFKKNTLNLKLNNLGNIIVKRNFETSLRNVFALGDLVYGPMLAHKAEIEANKIIHGCLKKKFNINYINLPNLVFTYPEISTVGLSEEELNYLNISNFKNSHYFLNNSKSLIYSDGKGFLKILYCSSNKRILGACIFNSIASELIYSITTIIYYKGTLSDLLNIISPHPTISEIFKEFILYK